MSEPSGELTNKPFAAQLSNVYFSILALFCFKLFVKISLNLLAYFYIVRGNRKEAARISAEFYDYGQQHSEYSAHGGATQDRRVTDRGGASGCPSPPLTSRTLKTQKMAVVCGLMILKCEFFFWVFIRRHSLL